MKDPNVLSIDQQSPNSLVRETLFPQSSLILRQSMAQPIIAIRNGFAAMANDPNSELGAKEVKTFEAGLPQIFQATESFMLRELSAIKTMQSDPDFDQEKYTANVLTEISPILSADPDQRQQQLDSVTATLSSLFAEVQTLPADTFISKDTADKSRDSLVPATVLQPVLATGVSDMIQRSNISLMSNMSTPNSAPNQGGANDVFNDFQKFLTSRTGGLSLGVLAAVVTAINIGTTGAGLGNWDFTAAEGGIRYGKLAVDMGLATIWNFGQTAALAFTVEYLRRGSLGKLAATIRNIKNESFGTYLNTGLGIGLGVLSYHLLKGDITFTAQALNRLGDVNMEYGIPLAILIEVGSQFFTAYGTPVSQGLRNIISGIGPVLSGIGRRPAAGNVRTINQTSNPNAAPNPLIIQLSGLIRQLTPKDQSTFRMKINGAQGDPQQLQQILGEVKAKLQNP